MVTRTVAGNEAVREKVWQRKVAVRTKSRASKGIY